MRLLRFQKTINIEQDRHLIGSEIDPAELLGGTVDSLLQTGAAVFVDVDESPAATADAAMGSGDAETEAVESQPTEPAPAKKSKGRKTMAKE